LCSNVGTPVLQIAAVSRIVVLEYFLQLQCDLSPFDYFTILQTKLLGESLSFTHCFFLSEERIPVKETPINSGYAGKHRPQTAG